MSRPHQHIEHEIVIGQPGRERDSFLRELNPVQVAVLEKKLRDLLREYGVEVSVQPVMMVEFPHGLKKG